MPQEFRRGKILPLFLTAKFPPRNSPPPCGSETNNGVECNTFVEVGGGGNLRQLRGGRGEGGGSVRVLKPPVLRANRREPPGSAPHPFPHRASGTTSRSGSAARSLRRIPGLPRPAQRAYRNNRRAGDLHVAQELQSRQHLPQGRARGHREVAWRATRHMPCPFATIGGGQRMAIGGH